MNPKIHFCPRCKQDRLKEWFGDPKASYAICLSCRVEVNGEKKEEPPKVTKQDCAICGRRLSERGEICSKCAAGLNCFENQVRLLGRAASYLSGKLRRSKKQKPRKLKQRNRQLQELIRRQSRDDKERHFRFEYAVSKR